MIKFIPEDEPETKPLTFGDVEVNQLFINENGWFCQKFSSVGYNRIADEHGNPDGNSFDQVRRDETIRRILPRIKKIEF